MSYYGSVTKHGAGGSLPPAPKRLASAERALKLFPVSSWPALRAATNQRLHELSGNQEDDSYRRFFAFYWALDENLRRSP